MALGQFESTTDIHYERPDVMMMFTENCVTEKIFRLGGLDQGFENLEVENFDIIAFQNHPSKL
jgi:hypothetical protein